MASVTRVDFVTLLFRTFASYPKNGTVDFFELDVLLDVHTSQLFKTTDNSDNDLKQNSSFSKLLAEIIYKPI